MEQENRFLEYEYKKLAFICFYGQIRSPERALESLKELRGKLESEGYTVLCFAHLWYDNDERIYDPRISCNGKSNKDNLNFFISEYNPTKMIIENSNKFKLKCKKLNETSHVPGYNYPNFISQMSSRRKVRNILYEYCKEKEISEPELKSFPVFMTRLDFGYNINSNLLNDFHQHPSRLFISGTWKYNDNFILMNSSNFLLFFEDFDQHLRDYLENDSRIPKVYGWWTAESMLMERTVDMGLEIDYNPNIPDRFR